MHKSRLAWATVAFMLYCHVAIAAEEVLNHPRGGNILVWMSGRPYDEATRLLASGVRDADLLGPLLACRVPSSTRVIVTNGGFFSSDILVTSGPEKGCRGTIANEYLSRNR